MTYRIIHGKILANLGGGESSKSTGRYNLGGVFFIVAARLLSISVTRETYSSYNAQPRVNLGVTAFLSFHFTVLAWVQGQCTSIPIAAPPCGFHHSMPQCVGEKYSTARFISATQS